MKPSVDYTRYDDERLISLIVQSDEDALAQFYDRYNRLVFSLALAIINDRATAEEITLDVFMRIWQKAGTYRSDRAKVTTWLTHITRHHAIDVLRRRAVRLDQYAAQWDDALSHADGSQPDPQESAERSLRRKRVRAALAQLPADQKQAVILAYFGGYSHQQIAEALKQPLGTIKTRVRSALQKLRESLGDERETQDTSVAVPSAYNNMTEKK
jgi:RNA polymerase sigma-70 factor, ECF subfamily